MHFVMCRDSDGERKACAADAKSSLSFLMCVELQDCGFYFPRDGHSVLVHGSEGTDSTLLISTLAQLIMDPCCRTLEGFLALLEREWVQVSEFRISLAPSFL